MIINYYLADKNTTELLKVSGSYKFDSWSKHYNLQVRIDLDFEKIFPIGETEVIGRFGYILDGITYYTDVTITDTINTSEYIIFDIYTGDIKPTKYNNEYCWSIAASDPINFDNYTEVFHYSSILNTSFEHEIGIETNIDHDFNIGILGKYYKIQYTVESNSLFNLYIMLGSNKGNIVQTSGTYTEYLKLTDLKKISFFASGLVTLSKFIIEEYTVIPDQLDFTDKEAFINNSWTLSYSLDTNNWVSFHSYIPDYYLNTNKTMYSIINDELSAEYTIRDEINNYITGSNNELITYYKYTYG